MSASVLRTARTVVAVVLSVAVIFGAQAVAVSSAPSSGVESTGAVVGRAGFDFLAGIRVFAAAVLWNRLDPQFHAYYSGLSFQNQIEILPTLRVIQWLNPQFEQTYYLAAYMLSRRGQTAAAVSLAREGVANNPRSGLLRANLVEMLIFQDRKKNLGEALAQARIGMGTDMTYQNPDDEYDAIVAMRLPFQIAEDTATVAALNVRLVRIRTANPTPAPMK